MDFEERPSSEAGGAATLTCRLEADLEEIPALTARIEAFAGAGSVPAQETQRIVLSIDELVTNIVRYGTEKDTAADIEVSILLDDDLARIRIEHRGVAFDPFREAPVPDTTLPLESRPIGGLGVFLVRSLMTSSSYERVEGKNRITLTRSLRAGDPEDSP